MHKQVAHTVTMVPLHFSSPGQVKLWRRRYGFNGIRVAHKYITFSINTFCAMQQSCTILNKKTILFWCFKNLIYSFCGTQHLIKFQITTLHSHKSGASPVRIFKIEIRDKIYIFICQTNDF